LDATGSSATKFAAGNSRAPDRQANLRLDLAFIFLMIISVT
jgi:hypothetical protein